MKAARLVKQRAPLEIVELPDPAPGPDEVIVQIDAEGICRTDWHVWNGDWGTAPGMAGGDVDLQVGRRHSTQC
jgi:D-arabinose 1-dehydrogenase-like Zn-dependent alcohol dehydrogenase